MNERIQELAEQAREYAITRHPVSNIVLIVNSEKFEEKFAELIVKECLEVVRQSDDECYDEWDYADRDLCGIIKEHFGVE